MGGSLLSVGRWGPTGSDLQVRVSQRPRLFHTGARKSQTSGRRRGEWDLGLKNLVDGAE